MPSKTVGPCFRPQGFTPSFVCVCELDQKQVSLENGKQKTDGTSLLIKLMAMVSLSSKLAGRPDDLITERWCWSDAGLPILLATDA